MEKKSYAGPIVMTAIGGTCLITSLLFFIYGLMFSALSSEIGRSAGRYGRETVGAFGAVFWVLFFIFLAAGLPLLIIGLNKLKAAKAWNRSLTATYTQPVYTQVPPQPVYTQPAPQTQIPKARYCTACGAVLAEGTSYCPVCGKKAD